ncbi:hypothetical protein [Actinoplanes sp. L3-i22]|uniref:hypothetical protein n=1 Tax=Actinoplanes sp. L3-i22 TaxID=2836373 RepID=UPI001C775373|nr:hypothetical protein [Actinoplanes sp. L3-i22]BCY07922.1 hypothetical protein L3i22_030100 [Actinoplanes sp. L3-i22]
MHLARLRGLGTNPAIPDDLFRRVLDHPGSASWLPGWLITSRDRWTDASFAAVAAHPDPAIRAKLARSWHSSGAQRARLVDDPDVTVRIALAAGPEGPSEPMPAEAYRRLATDPDRRVWRRLWISDSLPDVAGAVLATLDHPVTGRREPQEVGPAAAPRFGGLPADAPGDVVLRAFLESRSIKRDELLRHPAFPRTDLVRHADSPDWEARALVPMDPGASAELIDRLSRDEHPWVRARAAADGRLSVARVLELLADEVTAESAASNPGLPREVMERIVATGGADPPYPEIGGL